MFNPIIGPDNLTFQGVAFCSLVSLLIGAVIAFSYKLKSPANKSFLITLILLPVIVQSVIMIVNGNIGTGVAVMGAFSLIRFRSVAGNAKDICAIFLAMAAGIATGAGQIYFAMAFAAAICIVFVALKFVPLKENSNGQMDLKITVPEDFNFEQELNEVLTEYTKEFSMFRVKTSAMGSLYVIDYILTLKSGVSQKEFIDKLRVKNGNLPIVCSVHKQIAEEL